VQTVFRMTNGSTVADHANFRGASACRGVRYRTNAYGLSLGGMRKTDSAPQAAKAGEARAHARAGVREGAGVRAATEVGNLGGLIWGVGAGVRILPSTLSVRLSAFHRLANTARTRSKS
jgi:hypothetical protein